MKNVRFDSRYTSDRRPFSDRQQPRSRENVHQQNVKRSNYDAI